MAFIVGNEKRIAFIIMWLRMSEKAEKFVKRFLHTWYAPNKERRHYKGPRVSRFKLTNLAFSQIMEGYHCKIVLTLVVLYILGLASLKGVAAPTYIITVVLMISL